MLERRDRRVHQVDAAEPACGTRSRHPFGDVVLGRVARLLNTTSSFQPPNPLSGTFWATSVAGVLAYQWSKPIPVSLKIIHARVSAQGLTLAALAGAAAVDFYEHKAELERVASRLEHVEKKVHGSTEK